MPFDSSQYETIYYLYCEELEIAVRCLFSGWHWQRGAQGILSISTTVQGRLGRSKMGNESVLSVGCCSGLPCWHTENQRAVGRGTSSLPPPARPQAALGARRAFCTFFFLLKPVCMFGAPLILVCRVLLTLNSWFGSCLVNRFLGCDPYRFTLYTFISSFWFIIISQLKPQQKLEASRTRIRGKSQKECKCAMATAHQSYRCTS